MGIQTPRSFTKQGVEAYCASQAYQDPDRLEFLDLSSNADRLRRCLKPQLVDNLVSQYGMTVAQATEAAKGEMEKHYAPNPWDDDHLRRRRTVGEDSQQCLSKSEHDGEIVSQAAENQADHELVSRTPPKASNGSEGDQGQHSETDQSPASIDMAEQMDLFEAFIGSK